ncbi:hypothetical protein Rsub_00962 [Raphidocelis subcapitata]|uniref:Uncharacterized protein n=1 Tax=Raphidocelis subcapitata TaxID=307507 RepID=A0A2V0NRQ6_9CHLO|nr:hypothetical protein Rsub_00962 [Raphidocelis subcapitata]|eukprot:GBF88250.1 hypothetical protein Rsub_00962 [Raphidocelis subcapitata]
MASTAMGSALRAAYATGAGPARPQAAPRSCSCATRAPMRRAGAAPAPTGSGGGGRSRARAPPPRAGGSAGAALPTPVAYQWSWDGADGPGAPPQESAFDGAHPIGDAVTVQEFGALLSAAADSAVQPSAGWMAALCAAAAPGLGALDAAAACGLLQQLAAVGYCPPGGWQGQLLGPIVAAARGGSLPPAQLAEALWSLSNLSGGGASGPQQQQQPQQQEEAAGAAGLDTAAAARELLAAAARQLPDFFGPDLAKAVCAGATLAAAAAAAAAAPGGGAPAAAAAAPGGAPAAAAAPPPPAVDAAWAAAVLAECEYQLVEFSADFGAFDLARLALGLSLLSDLGADPRSVQGPGGWPEAGQRLRDALLKAVYARTRTIEEKAAVDYALARLDAKGKRSMHYDPRWTHEELSWLPRRERDKRRILKDGWYRSQWSGWRAG